MKRIIREKQLAYEEWESQLDYLLQKQGHELHQVMQQGMSLYPPTDFYERGFTPEQALDFIMKEIDRDEY